MTYERFDYCKSLNFDVLAVTELWRSQQKFQRIIVRLSWWARLSSMMMAEKDSQKTEWRVWAWELFFQKLQNKKSWRSALNRWAGMLRSHSRPGLQPVYSRGLPWQSNSMPRWHHWGPEKSSNQIKTVTVTGRSLHPNHVNYVKKWTPHFQDFQKVSVSKLM